MFGSRRVPAPGSERCCSACVGDCCQTQPRAEGLFPNRHARMRSTCWICSAAKAPRHLGVIASKRPAEGVRRLAEKCHPTVADVRAKALLDLVVAQYPRRAMRILPRRSSIAGQLVNKLFGVLPVGLGGSGNKNSLERADAATSSEAHRRQPLDPRSGLARRPAQVRRQGLLPAPGSHPAARRGQRLRPGAPGGVRVGAAVARGPLRPPATARGDGADSTHSGAVPPSSTEVRGGRGNPEGMFRLQSWFEHGPHSVATTCTLADSGSVQPDIEPVSVECT